MDEMVGKSALKSIYVNEPLEFDLISNNEWKISNCTTVY
jgi:hypothetical protein